MCILAPTACVLRRLYIHTYTAMTACDCVCDCVRIAADNQKLMAHEDAIGSLISLLDSDMDLIQRQAAKALANLGVNAANKAQIADEGGIPKLVRLATVAQIPVKIEAIAALANLAVNGMMLASACCDGSLFLTMSVWLPLSLCMCCMSARWRRCERVGDRASGGPGADHNEHGAGRGRCAAPNTTCLQHPDL